MNKIKGITLISLVITIIIIIILAGITIATLTGENGLFERAKQAKENTIKAQQETSNALANYEQKIDQILSGVTLKLISSYRVSSYNTNTATLEDISKRLFDGNIKNGGSYNAMLMGYANIEIMVYENIKIYAYGNKYSDSAGKTGKELVIQKYNGTSYEDYKTVKTSDTGEKYELVTLEPGKYKLTPSTPYVSFDEWEIELIK